jgi:serine/threonine-protein kinase
MPPTPAIRARTRGARVVVLALFLVGVLTAGSYLAWRAGSAAGSPIVDAAAPIRTIAVLPFVNTSGSSADDYFSDGLTDELAHALTRIAGLRIAGRTSSYAFKGKSVAAQEIGRALDVGALVSGTVRRAGNRLRVTTQLVSTSDGKVLWDSVYESRSADVFAVQDSLTRAVVIALTPALGVGGRGPAVAGRGTADEEAYDLYLRGRYLWQQRGGENVRRAISLLQQAVARDPLFARAHAALAMAYSTLPVYRNDSRGATALDTLSEGDINRLIASSAERAAALDSTLADAQLALGIMLDLRLQFRDALARYRRGVALDPSSVTAHHWLAMSLLNLGETDAAIVELRHATQLDPLNTVAAAALSTALVWARRFPEAASQAHRVLALDSSFAFGSMMLAESQVYMGTPDSAIQVSREALRLHPSHPGVLRMLLLADAAAGRWGDAARIRDQLRAMGPRHAAFAAVIFGEPEHFIRLLSSTEGLHQYIGDGGILGCDPLLDPLQTDARFREAMRKLTVAACPMARPLPVPPPPR